MHHGYFITSFLFVGSLRSPRQRRQRTTSINLNTTIDATESIIRSNNRTIYTAGRPPWYNCAGQQVEPFVIGLLFYSIQISFSLSFTHSVCPTLRLHVCYFFCCCYKWIKIKDTAGKIKHVHKILHTEFYLVF